MTIDAICFDFDGTLARYQGDFRAFGARSFAALGLPPEELDVAISTFSRCEKQNGHITVPGILRCVLDTLTLETSADLHEVAAAMLADYASEVRLLPGATELLELTRMFPKAIITNGPSDMQRAAIRAAGVQHACHILVSGDADVAVRKPDAAIFQLACSRLGTLPARTLMIGDNLLADVQGALDAGLHGLWLGQGEARVDTVADTWGALEYLQDKLSR